MMKLSDERGQPVVLGREIGRGGEALVTEIAGHPNLVAKIYSAAVTEEKAAKLRALLEVRHSDVETFAAWPTKLLFDGKRLPVGFAMRRVNGHKEIHELYGPKSRKLSFPQADFRFVAHVATNIARAFAALHSHSIIVGDVNQSGVLVSTNDGRVALVDCDSFQFSSRGRQFHCGVGQLLFTPPELQGKNFAGLIRTQAHDAFGLATLVFLLLFMGRHPFAGTYLGAGDMPPERAIKEGRFAFGDPDQTRMQAPPNAPPLDGVGELRPLFVRAFTLTQRPSALEWCESLARFQNSLRACTLNRHHFFPASTRVCPWCGIEQRTGVLLFPVSVLIIGTQTVDFARLWSEIERVTLKRFNLGNVDMIVPSTMQPSPDALAAQADRRRRMAFALPSLLLIPLALLSFEWIGGLAIYAIVASIWFAFSTIAKAKRGAETERLRHRFTDAELKATEARRQFDELERGDEFNRIRTELRRVYEDALKLPQIRAARLAELERNKRAAQLESFLERHFIYKAKIPGIGPGRIAILDTFGVETAADIVPGLRVQGFGPTYMGRLEAWRQSIEAQFRYDPRKPTDPSQVQKIETEIVKVSKDASQRLYQGRFRLQQIASDREARLPQLQRQWTSAILIRAQAKLDFDLVS